MITGIKQTGFTLFEMVVAVGIFAVMGTIAYPGLTQMAKTGQAVSESNLRISELQFAVAYINRDWLQVSPRKIRNRYGDEESNILIENNSITFTRGGRSNLLQQKRSSLQRVTYNLVGKNLTRQHWLSLDQGVGEEAFSTVLLKNVSGFEIGFIDRGTGISKGGHHTGTFRTEKFSTRRLISLTYHSSKSF